MGSALVFGILAVVALASAVLMLTSRNAVHSALWLVLNFATIGVFYLVLSAPFIAMVQITVYAGAIMVLFLFVIMLLGAERLSGVQGTSTWQRITAVMLAAVLVITLVVVLLQGEANTVASSGFIDTDPTASLA